MFCLDPRAPWCSVRRSKALTTEGTEDHKGNRQLINVDLFDALQYEQQTKAIQTAPGFEEEFVAFLKKHGVEYDAQYVWG
jgi:hypothetical protein